MSTKPRRFKSNIIFPTTEEKIEIKNGKSPSKKDMEEMFNEVVKFAKTNGCPVTVYPKKSKVHGSNGYFCADPKPHIKVAIKDKSWAKAMELIIHEFCHYWQWSDGFLGRKDDEGNIIYARILEGEDVTPGEREIACKLVRVSEYDCEIRTASLFEKWNLESIFPPEEHIKSCNTYNRHIIWSIGDKENKGSGVFFSKYDSLKDKLWGGTTFKHFWDPKTKEGRAKILAPLNGKHRNVFDNALSAELSRGKKTAAKKRRR
jgi:hypothetical protein